MFECLSGRKQLNLTINTVQSNLTRAEDSQLRQNMARFASIVSRKYAERDAGSRTPKMMNQRAHRTGRPPSKLQKERRDSVCVQ